MGAKSIDENPFGKRAIPLAKWPVLAMAGVVGAVLLLVSGRYGYFGDELYFLSAGIGSPAAFTLAAALVLIAILPARRGRETDRKR